MAKHQGKSKTGMHGLSLIELLIAVGIASVIAAGASVFFVRMQREMAAVQAQAASKGEAQNVMLGFRKSFIIKTTGNDAPCNVCPGSIVEPSLNGVQACMAAPPGPAYCIASCSAGKNQCKTVTMRRGTTANYEDTTFRTYCINAPANIKRHIAGRLYPSLCGTGCGADEMPVVDVVSIRTVGAAATKKTRFYPAKGVRDGSAKGSATASSIGTELCASIDETAGNPGVLTLNTRAFNFSLGDDVEAFQTSDVTEMIEEQTLQNSTVTFLP